MYALPGQPNSKLVIPKMHCSGNSGAGPRYMRAVSKTGLSPWRPASLSAAALGSGGSRNTGPGGASATRARKRSSASAPDAADPTAASSQSGKTEETLRKVYRPPKPEEKAALALQLDGLRRGA